MRDMDEPIRDTAGTAVAEGRPPLDTKGQRGTPRHLGQAEGQGKPGRCVEEVRGG